MNLLGEIEIKGPGLIKKLSQDGEFIFKETGSELILKVSNGNKEEVKFNVTTEMYSDSEISITTNFDDDPDIVDELFHFIAETKDGNGIGVSMSISQVRALAEIFQSYVTAYDLLQRCKGRSVKAESV